MSYQDNLNKYTTQEIVSILMLDESEYDSKMTPRELYESLEGIMITKIMGFEENYEEANKYILSVIKNANSSKIYDKYRNCIFDIIKTILFGGLNNEYFNNLIENLDKFLNKDYLIAYFRYLSEIEFFEFLSKINDIPKAGRYKLMNILTKSKSFRKTLLKKSNDGFSYEKEVNLFSIFRFQDDFTINDDEYQTTIENYLNDSESALELITYINDILDKNKIFGSNTLALNMVDYKKLSSSRFLALVLKFTLLMFKTINKDNIFKNIDRDFNTTQRKEYVPTIDDTVETKVYLLALKSLKTIHNSLIVMYSQIASYANSNDILNLFNFNQPQQMQEKLKISKELVFSDNLDSLVNNLIKYYISDFSQINSDAVDTVIQYYFNMSKIKKDFTYEKETINYFYKLLATSTEYCNKHYKFDILTLICSIYDKKEVDVKDNLELMKAIILYHDENDMFKIQDQPIAHKYYQSSLGILEKILSSSKIEENSMNDLFLKFFYRTNSHTISHLEFLNLICTEIDKKINDFNSEAFRFKYIGMIKEVIKSITLSLKVVNDILTKKILNPAIFRGEIILPVITLATNVLKFFTNGKIAIYNVFNMNFEALDIMKYSLYILHKLTVNDEFRDLIQESKDIVIDSLPFIKFHEHEKHIKDELKENLEMKKDDIKLEDVPEEFLDPLIYTLIKDPVMIPNVDLIFDKASIMSQIYHEKVNPYTREFLDENIMEVHNKKPDIIQKVAEFLDKINRWRNHNV